MSSSIQGKKVLVTGSGTGLGRETALEFARRGANLVLHYAHSEGGAMSALEEIRAMGVSATVFKADLSEVDQVQKLIDDAVAFHGGLDILVNNAGITLTREFELITPEMFDLVYKVNVRAQFLGIQRALPALENGGVVVNLSSIHGFQAFNGHSVYAGTKGAIIAHTRELAIELAPRGIRVNAVAPGAVPVENHFKLTGNSDPHSMDDVIPCGFTGQPMDIANIVVFMASPESRYIVGQTILADGGTSSWMSFSEGFKEMGLRLGGGYVPGF